MAQPADLAPQPGKSGDGNRSVLEGHRVAEVVVTVRNPSAVEADELRLLGQFLDFVEPVVADQDTQVPLMVALTIAFFHVGSYYFVFPGEFQPPPSAVMKVSNVGKKCPGSGN
jgi:hypothetical protein